MLLNSTTTIPFDAFIERIAPTAKDIESAKGRCDDDADLLRSCDDFSVEEIIQTGSLFRGTALKPTADPKDEKTSDGDVIAILSFNNHLLVDPTPKEAMDLVREHFSQHGRVRVRKNGQAVTLYYKQWPHVDIVPAKRAYGTRAPHPIEIADTTRGRWVGTDPKSHDAAMATFTDDEKKLVQMMKYWNETHGGYLESFHIEVMILSMLKKFPRPPFPSQGSGNAEWDWPLRIVSFFGDSGKLLGLPEYWHYLSAEEANIPLRSFFLSSLTHPTGASATIDDYLSDSDYREIISRLRRGFEHAINAFNAIFQEENDEKALESYRRLFGDLFPSSV